MRYEPKIIEESVRICKWKDNHTKDNRPSQLNSYQRNKEIKEHYKKKGTEYILPGEGI